MKNKSTDNKQIELFEKFRLMVSVAEIASVRLIESNCKVGSIRVDDDKMDLILPSTINNRLNMHARYQKERKNSLTVNFVMGMRACYPDQDIKKLNYKDFPLFMQIVIEINYFVPVDFDVTEELLREFGGRFAIHTAWPYWREFASVMSNRMGLPPILIPLLKYGGNSFPQKPDKPQGPKKPKSQKKKK